MDNSAFNAHRFCYYVIIITNIGSKSKLNELF